ncbi:hypothetical protein GCM10022381_35050 [Leifsonia kafniensis]|uniref:Uncharacterized protein n=1 Tax=Leifsonia kafniensis TaxID=475957 RepID=A0ABP7KY61_9MICO
MNFYPAIDLFGYFYWLLLILVTVASLVAAAFAFKFARPLYAIVSGGTLAAALLLAALPNPDGQSSFGTLLGIIALALSVIGGGPIAAYALRLATRDSVAPGAYGGILVEDSPGANTAVQADGTNEGGAVHEVLRGGLAIGILERLAVTGAILAGFPEAIAVVVAIKGVGRFTELAASEARERFIIGTLASLTWACACAALVRLAIA